MICPASQLDIVWRQLIRQPGDAVCRMVEHPAATPVSSIAPLRYSRAEINADPARRA